MPTLNGKDAVKVLLRANFFIHHQKGSHVHLRHKTKTGLRVTIPCHAHFDLPPSVIKSILKQSELSLGDFLKIL